MRPMAAAAVGALISGIAVYAVGARAAQNPFAEMPAYVQTVDGRYIQATVAPRVVQQARAPARVYRTAAPAQRTVVRETEVVEDRPQRTWTKTAMIVGGSAASGAGVGGLMGGKKGALVGAAIGGGAASIYEATRRR
jgi:hypothetical protein